MLILALETSGNPLRLGLFDARQLKAIRSAPGQKSAAKLTSLIQELLQESQTEPRSVQAIAISKGPGSFTGLRAGLVTAKVWAYSLRCPMVAIPTHEIIAQQAFASSNSRSGTTWVVSDAQRKELFASGWQLEATSHSLVCSNQLIVASPEHIQSLICQGDRIVGPKASLFPASPGTPGIPDDTWLPEPAILAELAIQRLTRGVQDDPFLVKPIYGRLSAAEEKIDRAF